MIQNSETDFNEIPLVLEKTLSPDPSIRRPAEKLLEQLENHEGFGTVLLALCNKQDIPMHLRISASIKFKNFIKKTWKSDDDQFSKKITEQDRINIKSSIIELMLTSPEQIQSQLSDAISIISREDFPEKWPDLLNNMIEKMKSGEFYIINGVLKTAHSIFKRYRHEFQSNELWKEIKYVLGVFCLPLTELFQSLMLMIEKSSNDFNGLKLIFNSIILVCKIFRSLTAQDLPEEVENTMEIWMNSFLSLLDYDNPILRSDSNEAGLLEQTKSQICDNVSLFAQNYGDDFADYLPKFVSAVWNLLITTGLESKYDILVSNSIQFITAVVYRPQYKSLFENEDSLKNICEKIVIPNLFLRDVDIEAFEDNPEEYIRKDIERSDSDTRRKAASDLVQSLTSQFEKQVVGIFSTYVNVLLQEFMINPQKNWRQKDVVLFLVTTLASRAQTKKHGTTKASELIDVVQFFESTLLSDLTDADVNSFPVIKADVMRYITTFRLQLPKDTLLNIFPNLVRFLASNVPVVNTYACYTIERILTIKAPGSRSNLISSDVLIEFMPHLINNILNLLHPVTNENEYAMRTLMRLSIVMQEKIDAFVDLIIPRLIELLNSVSKNPSKPHFNHYLFETFGILIRTLSTKNPNFIEKFEQNLFPTFNYILEQDVTEFIPYTFQLLSLMLEFHDQTIPSVYYDLFPYLLMPLLWERPGYIPALVKLLQAYIKKASAPIVSEKIEPVLGIFQKLIASKANDNYAFDILNNLIEYLSPSVLSQYIKKIFILMFQRLNTSKTVKLVKSILVFFSLYTYKFGFNNIYAIINEIQSGMFLMVLENLYIADLHKVSGSNERKICAVGVIKILTEYSILIDDQSFKGLWIRLLESLISFFETPEESLRNEEDLFVELEDISGFQGSYNQLQSTCKKELDPFDDQIESQKIYLARQLETLSRSKPGKIPNILSELNIDCQKFLQGYIKEANAFIN